VNSTELAEREIERLTNLHKYIGVISEFDITYSQCVDENEPLYNDGNIVKVTLLSMADIMYICRLDNTCITKSISSEILRYLLHFHPRNVIIYLEDFQLRKIMIVGLAENQIGPTTLFFEQVPNYNNYVTDWAYKTITTNNKERVFKDVISYRELTDRIVLTLLFNTKENKWKKPQHLF
jgi:hypothetical protein